MCFIYTEYCRNMRHLGHGKKFLIDSHNQLFSQRNVSVSDRTQTAGDAMRTPGGSYAPEDRWGRTCFSAYTGP